MLTMIHRTKPYIHCPVEECPRTFIYLQAFQSHLQRHHGFSSIATANLMQQHDSILPVQEVHNEHSIAVIDDETSILESQQQSSEILQDPTEDSANLDKGMHHMW